MRERKKLLINHLKQNALIYIFTTVLFLTGVIFGSIVVNSMSFVQKQDLFFYLERFFLSLTEGQQLTTREIVIYSFLYHMKYIAIIFLFGLAIIALPLVWIFVFLKGIVIGFSVGFLVNQLGFKGLLLAATSIAPQNIITIPIYIIAGSLSMLFCLQMVRRLFNKKNNIEILEPFTRYFIAFLCLLCLASIGSIIEGILSNEAMQVVVRSFYK